MTLGTEWTPTQKSPSHETLQKLKGTMSGRFAPYLGLTRALLEEEPPQR